MKKNILKIAIITTIAFTILFISQGCLRKDYIKLAGFTQGTSYHITYESKRGENFQEEIDTLLADFDKTFSVYLTGSIISRINRNDPDVIINEHFVKVFQKAYEIYKATEGFFDITVAPLVNAWGFGFTEKANVDSTIIDSLLQYVGMDKVQLKDRRIQKKYNEIMLDCNAIAQGYAVDVISDYFNRKGIKNYLVEIGGEINTRGVNEKGNIWLIGLDKPIEGNILPGMYLQAKIRLKNSSLATSGNYRKFYEKDGIKYAHSINPKSGYPVLKKLLSATVIAEDCMTADAFATAFMVMGLEKAKEFLREHKELDAYLIFSDDQGEYQVFTTGGMRRNIME